MSGRLFDEHLVRPVVDLGGQWDFVTEPEVTETDDAGLPTEYTRRIQVPGCWESPPGLASYRGKAWYRMPLVQSEAGPLRLVFKGASHTATVFVDGEKVGGHYNAYTAFEVALRELAEGDHDLVVEVDNSFGEHSALHKDNDYYTYGGLTRPVLAEGVAEQYIQWMHVTPKMGPGETWSAHIRVQVRNLAKTDAQVGVRVGLAELDVDLGGVSIERDGTAHVEATVDVPDVAPWTPDSPELYHVQAVLISTAGEPIDDLIDRIGFRQVGVDGTELLLNGTPLKIRGFNRHEDDPHFGCAIPVEAMVRDIELMEDMGANLDRTCHYPNDERWLDLCDERGVLVWEENHARGLKLDHMQNPNFQEQALACTEEMVEQHFNHPSIILWGILNECASHTDDGKAMYAEQFELIKRLDPGRPTTFASCHQYEDLSLDLPDVVGFNLYTAWYGSAPDEVRERIDKLIEWIDSAGGGGKPLIISEFGAGAIYGCRQPQRVDRWSEEYQALALDRELACYLHHPRISGAIIWQFCDCRVTDGWAGHRPRAMNNKGVVDEYRRPKMGYNTVKRHFRGG